MRAWAAVSLLSALCLSVPHSGEADSCNNADPTGELAGVAGDFEMLPDPQDPAANLIFISNVADGHSSIVAARIDGTTGMPHPGTLTTIATNFIGQTSQNGPEFVQLPSGALGVLYRGGARGVFGVFRHPAPSSWEDFQYDVTGAKSTTPSPLPSTVPGAYDGGGLALQQYTYAQFLGACSGKCYGAMPWGTSTDVVRVLADQYGLFVPVANGDTNAITQSPRDGWLFLSACDVAGSCGLYQAEIDGDGGFVPGTVQLLAPIRGTAASTWLAAQRHPVTGTIVLFSRGTGTNNAVDVWEQPAFGGALRLLGRVPVIDSDHYRVRESPTEIVLHFLVRSGKDAGSYVIPVSASDNTLQVGPAEFVGTAAGGPKFEWLPAAGKFALYYRISRYPSQVFRCWVTP